MTERKATEIESFLDDSWREHILNNLQNIQLRINLGPCPQGTQGTVSLMKMGYKQRLPDERVSMHGRGTSDGVI